MDEHSQLQLFLDGPDDKFYDIISSKYKEANILASAQIDHAVMLKSMLEAKGRIVEHACHDEINEDVVGHYIGAKLVE
jgi:hypothetical protein